MSNGKRPNPSPLLVASAIYYGCLSLVSHIPGRALAPLSANIWDKAAHFAVFLVLGALLFWGFERLTNYRRRLHVVVLTAAVVLVLGVLDEAHQLFVAGRFATIGDAVADFLGGTTGALSAFSASAILGLHRNA
jgi:VanZ family protein